MGQSRDDWRERAEIFVFVWSRRFRGLRRLAAWWRLNRRTHKLRWWAGYWTDEAWRIGVLVAAVAVAVVSMKYAIDLCVQLYRGMRVDGQEEGAAA